MKRLSVLFLVLASVQAFSAPVTVYNCKSKDSGFRYEAIPAYGELHEWDEKGNSLGHQDGLHAKYKFIETYPSKTVIKFIDSDGGNTYFTITEMGKKITMEYDDDSSITCKKELKKF